MLRQRELQRPFFWREYGPLQKNLNEIASDACTQSLQAPEYSGYGVPYRHSRGDKLPTPSGPEGSSGSSGFGRRDVAGAGCRLLNIAAHHRPQ